VNEAELQELAERLASNAGHPSVKAEVLLGSLGRISKAYLNDQPPVAYLEDDEAVAFLLRSDGKGVGIGGGRDTTSPTGSLSAVTLVTDRRTVCLVGQSSGDAVVAVPHRDVAGVDYKAGLLGSRRLVVRTDRTVYLFYANRSVGKDVLDGAAAYIYRRSNDGDDGDDGDGGASAGGAVFTG
jgi:hypothetical protein